MSKPTTTHTFGLAKVKTFNGIDGVGLNAEITMDGKTVCTVIDEGNGGQVHLDWYRLEGKTRERGNADARLKLVAYLRDRYEAAGGDAAYELRMKADGCWFEGCAMSKRPDDDLIEDWVNTIVDEMEMMKRLKRLARTKTVFRLKGEPTTSLRTLSVPLSDPRAMPELRRVYGDKLEFVFNPDRPCLSGIN